MRKKELNRIEQLEATILRMANYIEKPKNKFFISKTFTVKVWPHRFSIEKSFDFKIIEIYFDFELFQWNYICVDQNQNTTIFTELEVNKHNRF
jgi:hypothetical protein